MQANSGSRDDDELAGALYRVMVRVARLRVESPVDKAGVAVLHEMRLLGTVRPSDLAARMHLDLSTISRHLHALEQQGMVERTPDPADARAQRISVTARGSDIVSRLLEHRATTIRDAIAHWPQDDRRVLRQNLCRLADDLSRVSETSPSPGARDSAHVQDSTETQ